MNLGELGGTNNDHYADLTMQIENLKNLVDQTMQEDLIKTLDEIKENISKISPDEIAKIILDANSKQS